MKQEPSTKGAITTGVIAAIAASSCCIPPFIAAIAGVSGASTNLAWMGPFRPYLIGLAIAALGYSWYSNLKPKKKDDCGCEVDKPKWFQTKGFLISITLFASLSIAFPHYSGFFFSNNMDKEIIDIDKADVTYASIQIEGMTCMACENHIQSVVNSIDGILKVSTSHELGRAEIKFDKTKTSTEQIQKSIERETRYKVIQVKILNENE